MELGIDLSFLQITFLCIIIALANLDRTIFKLGFKSPLLLGVISGFIIKKPEIGLTTGLVALVFYALMDNINNITLPNYSVATILVTALIAIEPGVNGLVSIFLINLIAALLMLVEVILKLVNTINEDKMYLGVIISNIVLLIVSALILVKGPNVLSFLLSGNELFTKIIINFVGILPLLAFGQILGKKKDNKLLLLSLFSIAILYATLQISLIVSVFVAIILALLLIFAGRKETYQIGDSNGQ